MKRLVHYARPAGAFLLVLLAFSLPFELETGLMMVGPLTLTNVELLLFATLGCAAIIWLGANPETRRDAATPRLWQLLALLFLGALLATALIAPALRANALKASLRTATGLLLAGASPLLMRNRRDFIGVIAALVTGSVLAALLGWYEISAGVAQEWLAPFRPAPSVTGAFLRLSGSFDYANQASMYLEGVLPLFVALTWWTVRQRLWGWFFVTLLGSAVLIQAIMLTLSRTGFVTVFLTGLVVALFTFAGRQTRAQSAAWGAVSAATAGIFMLNLLWNPAFRLRLQSEGDDAWYRVRYDVPAELQMVAQEETRIRVSVTNDSIVTWRNSGPNHVRLMARWIDDARNLEIGMLRWELPEPLPPGETATWEIAALAPPHDGQYRMLWDLEHVLITWFSTKNGLETTSRVNVLPNPAVSAPAEQAGSPFSTGANPWQIPAPIPARRTLWRAALELFRDHPLLGIGLDNFRLTYGEALGYEDANPTIHTNNWYLELLVSTGLLGTVPFLLWLGLLGWDIVRTLRHRDMTMWHAGVAAGILAFLLHGLLDYFMLFNATALLFWLLVGLWRWQRGLIVDQ